MSLYRTFCKIACQTSHLLAEITTPAQVIYIDGDLHYNYTRHDFMAHNLGDDLNLPMVAALSHRKPIPVHYVFGHRRHADVLLAIGSILEACCRSNSVVWGAGFIRPPMHVCRPRRICAVRGPLTRSVYLANDIECPEIFGDPALLLPRFYTPSIEKRHDCALIPHLSDWDCAFAEQWRNSGRPCISLKEYGNWHDVIDQLCQCRTVISSSLHGIILAEAYGIPALWIKLSDRLTGGDFKFQDYYLSYRDSMPECLTDTAPRETPFYADAAYKQAQFPSAEMKESLLKAFPYSN